MFLKKLYVRIWLAVVLAVAVLTFLVGWAWRMTAEPPLREVVIHDETGQLIGKGHARRMRPLTPEGMVTPVERDSDGIEAPARGGPVGRGPEFVVSMADGRVLHMHLPRPPPAAWNRPPFGFFWMLGLVGVAVALATYPIIRKLTQRLERLQGGVEKWGAGDLSVRVPVSGQDEVAFLATRFNHAAEQIETLVASQKALLASQKSLLANASHELRSPLTRIRMGLELMAPTLVAARTALPPEGAELARGGPSLRSMAPTLVASPASDDANAALDVSLPEARALRPVPTGAGRSGAAGLSPEWAELARGGPSLRSMAPPLVVAPGLSSPSWRDEISRNIDELDQLIAEILLASRLDAHEADLGTVESVDLVGLAAEECGRTQAELEVQTGILDAIAPVQGVTRLLRRAVRNLLENARRYGAGEVSVILRQTPSEVEVWVCDRGPGVPEGLRDRIFQPFYRLPGATERDGGVGLGLSLVKSIAARHGGHVRCEAREGGGACFVLRLPAAVAS